MTGELELILRHSTLDRGQIRLFPGSLPDGFALDIAHAGQRLIGSVEQNPQMSRHLVYVHWDDDRPTETVFAVFQSFLQDAGFMMTTRPAHKERTGFLPHPQTGFSSTQGSLELVCFVRDPEEVMLEIWDHRVKLIWCSTVLHPHRQPSPLDLFVPRLLPPEPLLVMPGFEAQSNMQVVSEADMVGPMPLPEIASHYRIQMQNQGWTLQHLMHHPDEIFESHQRTIDGKTFRVLLHYQLGERGILALMYLRHAGDRAGVGVYTISTRS